jgi:hypothetical protein
MEVIGFPCDDAAPLEIQDQVSFESEKESEEGPEIAA